MAMKSCHHYTGKVFTRKYNCISAIISGGIVGRHIKSKGRDGTTSHHGDCGGAREVLGRRSYAELRRKVGRLERNPWKRRVWRAVATGMQAARGRLTYLVQSESGPRWGDVAAPSTYSLGLSVRSDTCSSSIRRVFPSAPAAHHDRDAHHPLHPEPEPIYAGASSPVPLPRPASVHGVAFPLALLFLVSHRRRCLRTHPRAAQGSHDDDPGDTRAASKGGIALRSPPGKVKDAAERERAAVAEGEKNAGAWNTIQNVYRVFRGRSAQTQAQLGDGAEEPGTVD
jgi:hypothetical protein